MRLYRNYSKKLTYLIAVSGGPDSMALWHDLITKGYNLIAVHVNYHHREVASKEEEMVREFATKNHCKIEVLNAYYDEKYGNFEAWARKVRYTFFKKVGKKYHVSNCFVAHNLDDYLETYYMQKRRGYVTYYGIRESVEINGILIIRPAIKISKKRLEQYCVHKQVPYSIDVTNNDQTLLRNWIRHNVVSKLSCKQKKELYNKIEDENTTLFYINSQAVVYARIEDVDILVNLDDELFERTLFFKAQLIDKRIVMSKKRIQEIRRMLKTTEGNQIFDLTRKYQFVREYNSLRIVEKKVYNYNLRIEKPQIVDTKYFMFDLIKNPRRLYIKEDSYPLTIRNAYYPHKVLIGSVFKKVNRLMIDAKIPYLKRLYWPEIVNNKGEIIFIPRTTEDENGLFVVKEL